MYVFVYVYLGYGTLLGNTILLPLLDNIFSSGLHHGLHINLSNVRCLTSLLRKFQQTSIGLLIPVEAPSHWVTNDQYSLILWSMPCQESC